MNIEQLAETLPEWAKDLRLNLLAAPKTEGLSTQQAWGTILAVAQNTRSPALIRAVEASLPEGLSEAARRAARGAAAIMAMNNVYYRFTHLVSDKTYAQMPARLRMQFIGSHGVDKADFELWCLAVSAANGCGACVDSHEQAVIRAGASQTQVHNVVRIAAVVNAVGVTLDAASFAR